jgi:hypothetical protein
MLRRLTRSVRRVSSASQRIEVCWCRDCVSDVGWNSFKIDVSWQSGEWHARKKRHCLPFRVFIKHVIRWIDSAITTITIKQTSKSNNVDHVILMFVSDIRKMHSGLIFSTREQIHWIMSIKGSTDINRYQHIRNNTNLSPIGGLDVSEQFYYNICEVMSCLLIHTVWIQCLRNTSSPHHNSASLTSERLISCSIQRRNKVRFSLVLLTTKGDWKREEWKDGGYYFFGHIRSIYPSDLGGAIQ